MEKKLLFFCYGTLKKGHVSHHLISSQGGVFVGDAVTHPRYCLYDHGGFPGMVVGEEGTGVRGEVYELPESAFMDLDRYECVDKGLFRKENIELSDGTFVLAYLFDRPYDESTEIASGVWP